MVKTEIASIKISLESDGNPCADVFVSKSLIAYSREIPDLVRETAEKLTTEIFEKIGLPVVETGYEENGKYGN